MATDLEARMAATGTSTSTSMAAHWVIEALGASVETEV